MKIISQYQASFNLKEPLSIIIESADQVFPGQSGLPVHHQVEQGNVFQAIQEFRPEVVLCDWPPGQSFAGICQADFLRYIMVVGEAGGGATGVPQDWQTLRHRESPALSRYGRGRTGTEKHRVTVFYGCSRRPSPGHSGWRCNCREPGAVSSRGEPLVPWHTWK